MDAELQFFMTEKDQDAFFDFTRKHVNKIEVIDEVEKLQRFIVGGCELLFTPSLKKVDVLYMGCLEIRLGNSDAALQDIERAKSVFRKLRNWLKKKYFSRLAYFNQKGKLIPSRVHWLGSDAKQWKQGDIENRVLKLSKTSWMIFDIGF